MLIDVLNSYNYISFNIDAASILGLNAAVYCAEVLNIYKKASIKKKLIDGDYFKLDRGYISNRTSLTIEDQLKVEANLSKIGLITKQVDNPDNIKIDVELYASIISSEDKKLIKDISSKVKIKDPKGVKMTQRHMIQEALKKGIVCSNDELLSALKDWVDAIFTNPNNYLSKKTIEMFQNTLSDYTKGDLDLALRLVKIATIQGWKDCEWAIKSYEQDQEYTKKNELRKPRVTDQKVATKDTIGKDIF